MDNVVEVTIYFVHMSHREEVASIRSQYWCECYVASTIMEIKSLVSKDYLIDIDGIAVLAQ